MKTRFLLLVFIGLTVLYSCVKNNGDDSDIPVYSYTNPIVNPPDEFLVVFNTSWVGDRVALLELDSNSVWLVEKLGDGRINLFLKNDSAIMALPNFDTLGLKGRVAYKIIVNNLYTSEFNNFFVAFTRQDNVYETFEPKF